MENSGFTRRHALKVTAVFGIALMAGIEKVSALTGAEKTHHFLWPKFQQSKQL